MKILMVFGGLVAVTVNVMFWWPLFLYSWRFWFGQ